LRLRCWAPTQTSMPTGPGGIAASRRFDLPARPLLSQHDCGDDGPPKLKWTPSAGPLESISSRRGATQFSGRLLHGPVTPRFLSSDFPSYRGGPGRVRGRAGAPNFAARKERKRRTVFAGGESQRLLKGRDIPGDWQRLFGSRQLLTLTERALKNNTGIATAQAALRVAQANLAAGKGAYFPTVTRNFSATRQMSAVTPPSPDQNGNLLLAEGPTYSLFTGQVQVSYTPDVFGSIRRNIKSLQAQSDNQRFQLETTYMGLTSNIALAAIQKASPCGQIHATRKFIQIANDVLKLLPT
jgi:Outer membrane efflux protein